MLTLDPEDYEALGFGDIQGAYLERSGLWLAKRRESYKSYNHSPQGRERNRRFSKKYRKENREKVLALTRKFQQTPAGKLVWKRANAKYRKTAKGKEASRRNTAKWREKNRDAINARRREARRKAKDDQRRAVPPEAMPATGATTQSPPLSR